MKKFRNGWIFVIMLLMVAGCMLAPTVSAAPAAQTGSGIFFRPLKTLIRHRQSIMAGMRTVSQEI